LGTLDDKWLFTGKKGKYILKSVMENKLPQEILDFRKIGLSAPWNNYLLSNSKFKEELEDFAKSDIFNMPFLENINGKKLVTQVKKGDTKIIPYVLPLFMLHIWQKNTFKSLNKVKS
jgi:asparagine synthase (glutamine-hydrolysing)